MDFAKCFPMAVTQNIQCIGLEANFTECSGIYLQVNGFGVGLYQYNFSAVSKSENVKYAD